MFQINTFYFDYVNHGHFNDNLGDIINNPGHIISNH